MDLFRIPILLALLILIPSISISAESITIEYQSLEIDKDNEKYIYTLPKVRYKHIEITGDKLLYDKSKEKLTFSGNVTMKVPNVLIFASDAKVDLDASIANLFNATMFDQKNGIFINAKQITQKTEDEYMVTDGSITYCDPKTNAWELRGKHIVYRFNNFAYSLGTSMHFYTLPIFYSPFFSWPTKKSRSSGFLVPTYLHTSPSDRPEGYGNRLLIPYFFNIDKDQDLTVTADIIEKRGIGFGFEYNYAFIPGMAGTLYS